MTYNNFFTIDDLKRIYLPELQADPRDPMPFSYISTEQPPEDTFSEPANELEYE